MTTAEFKLEILAEAQALIMFEKAWSKLCSATKNGEQCPAWDLHANAWSALGAIEKVLCDKNQYRLLVDVARELENDAKELLAVYDFNHSHKEVVDLFYISMARLSESIGWNMYTPFGFLNEEDDNDGFVFFISKEDDDAMDQYTKELEERIEESYRRDREALDFLEDD